MFTSREQQQLTDEFDALRKANRALSDAYLRLRRLIPGAFDTPTAPTAEEVWITTESALKRLVMRAEIRQEASSG